jgi:hypothetical protein
VGTAIRVEKYLLFLLAEVLFAVAGTQAAVRGLWAAVVVCAAMFLIAAWAGFEVMRRR